MPEPDFDFMEDFTRRSLRGLPPRPAPASLEARVLGRLEDAARRPSLLRALAVVLSVAALVAFVVVPTLVARHGGAASVVDLLAGRFSSVAVLQTLWLCLTDAARAVRAALPDSWLLWGLGAVAVSYAVLAGLGTAAYRLCHRRGRKAWAALT